MDWEGLLLDNLDTVVFGFVGGFVGVVCGAFAVYIGAKLRRPFESLFSIVFWKSVEVVSSSSRYVWRNCRELSFRLYLLFCNKGRIYEREVIAARIWEMISDAKHQRHASYIEEASSNDSDEIVREYVELLAVGRWDALLDVLSHLKPDSFPAETWDNINENATRLSKDKVIYFGDGITWNWHYNETNIWKYLARQDKKWGREQRIYFRKEEGE